MIKVCLIGGRPENVPDIIFSDKFIKKLFENHSLLRLLLVPFAKTSFTSSVNTFRLNNSNLCSKIDVWSEMSNPYNYEAIHIMGGDQNLLARWIRKNNFQSFLKKFIRETDSNQVKFISGTSAGAIVLGSYFYGNDEKTLAIGINLIQSSIIETHFSQKSRLIRLWSAMNLKKLKYGFGIDENTALVGILKNGKYSLQEKIGVNKAFVFKAYI